ncbi:uncharacterized protein LOC108136886 isoform X2 [Drosophila elegans]|uniref:uncharacterized protein LOC108136886 isoform X2 n=1 Tax=Drosophila elegans TaxID=30023 RepID=UPI001BC85BE8|nr:uncharacterized protein LOC108136886 isoform X2 [Drosophila elegans]
MRLFGRITHFIQISRCLSYHAPPLFRPRSLLHAERLGQLCSSATYGPKSTGRIRKYSQKGNSVFSISDNVDMLRKRISCTGTSGQAPKILPIGLITPETGDGKDLKIVIVPLDLSGMDANALKDTLDTINELRLYANHIEAFSSSMVEEYSALNEALQDVKSEDQSEGVKAEDLKFWETFPSATASDVDAVGTTVDAGLGATNMPMQRHAAVSSCLQNAMGNPGAANPSLKTTKAMSALSQAKPVTKSTLEANLTEFAVQDEDFVEEVRVDVPQDLTDRLNDMAVTSMELSFEMDMTSLRDALDNKGSNAVTRQDPMICMHTKVELDASGTVEQTVPLRFNALISGVVEIDSQKLNSAQLTDDKMPGFNDDLTTLAANLCSTALERGFSGNSKNSDTYIADLELTKGEQAFPTKIIDTSFMSAATQIGHQREAQQKIAEEASALPGIQEVEVPVPVDKDGCKNPPVKPKRKCPGKCPLITDPCKDDPCERPEKKKAPKKKAESTTEITSMAKGGDKKDPCAKDGKGKDKKKDPCAKFKKGGNDGDKKDGCDKDKKKDPCAKDKKKEDPCAKKDDKKKKDPCAKFKSGEKKDPCAKDKKKEDPCAKKKDPCAKKDEKKKDPCAKKDDKKKDPCAKKDEKKKDPCPKKDDKKKEDPCAKKKDPCAKKDDKKKDPCAKKDDKKKKDPCAKKDDKKKKDPCAKKDDKKKKDPCAKKDDKKKKDPCAKKDDKKKKDPCAKKDDKKKKDPCAKKDDKKKKDPCAKKDDKKKKDPCAKKDEKKKDPCAKKDDKKKKDPCAKFKKGGKDGKDKCKFSTFSRRYLSTALDQVFRESDAAPGGPRFHVYSTLVRRHYRVPAAKTHDLCQCSLCQKLQLHKATAPAKFTINSAFLRRRFSGLTNKILPGGLANANWRGKKDKKGGKCGQMAPKYPKSRGKDIKERTGLREDCFKDEDGGCGVKSCTGKCAKVKFPKKKCERKEKKDDGRIDSLLARNALVQLQPQRRSLSTRVCCHPKSEDNHILAQQAYALQISKSYEIKVVPVSRPSPKDFDVLIRTGSVAISNSDIHVYENGNRDVEAMSLGHDATGIVEEVGRCVHHLHVGDRVVVESALSCGICELCKQGLYNMCSSLVYNGFLSTYQTHPADLCHRLPPSISMEEGALTQTLALGCQACFKGNITPTSNVLILGSCPTAVAAGICAKAIGAKRVAIAGCMAPALDVVARDFGFQAVEFDSNALFGEVLEAIYSKFQDWPSCVINCSISAMTMNLAVMALQPCGVCVLAECDSECASFNALDVLMKNIRLVPSFRSANMYPTALQLMRSGRAPMHKFITNTYPLSRADEAFRTAQHESNIGLGKIIVNCAEEVDFGDSLGKNTKSAT